MEQDRKSSDADELGGLVFKPAFGFSVCKQLGKLLPTSRRQHNAAAPAPKKGFFSFCALSMLDWFVDTGSNVSRLAFSERSERYIASVDFDDPQWLLESIRGKS